MNKLLFFAIDDCCHLGVLKYSCTFLAETALGQKLHFQNFP